MDFRFLKYALCGLALLVCDLGSLPAASPNFVVIMTDDLGASQLSCYGSQEIKTPQLDQLASQGMRFQTCYATPNCSVTRMMLMTGRYGFRTGWYNFLEREYSPRPGSPQFDIGRAEITFADLLKQQGYATAIAGKWQLPGTPENRIFDCGFDEYFMWMWKHQLPQSSAKTGQGTSTYDPLQSLHSFQKTNRYWDPAVMSNRKRIPTKPDDFGPDLFTDYVCDYISKERQQPFLIYYSMVMIHKHNKTLPGVPDLNHPGQQTTGGSVKLNVEYVDHLVGRISQALDRSGLADNTYLIFTGDNGPAQDGKGEVVEKGARVPLIIRGPGIRAGAVTDELASLADIFPTIAEIADAPLPKDRQIDGISLAPVLFDKPGARREWLFSYLADQRMLRSKRWLLEGDGQFYDCGDHRDGTHYKNVTDSTQPEVRAAREKFEQILKRLPAPVKKDS